MESLYKLSIYPRLSGRLCTWRREQMRCKITTYLWGTRSCVHTKKRCKKLPELYKLSKSHTVPPAEGNIFTDLRCLITDWPISHAVTRVTPEKPGLKIKTRILRSYSVETLQRMWFRQVILKKLKKEKQNWKKESTVIIVYYLKCSIFKKTLQEMQRTRKREPYSGEEKQSLDIIFGCCCT